MALNWDTSKIENNEEVCFHVVDATPTEEGGRRLKPLTESFIWSCISIGIGQWNEINASEVYARLKIIEALDGAFIMRAGEDGKGFEEYKIVPQDVLDHIGLYVNVSYESRKDWAQRIFVGRGDGLIKYGTKVSPKVDSDEWFDITDVSKTSSLARSFRKTMDKVEA